ncbi:MAG: CHAT domain-containing protein [Elainellaceae cyanobacterium]
MRCQFRPSKIRRLLGVLFLSSLFVCLWLGHIEPRLFNQQAIAQQSEPSNSASELVRQGVERYQAGDFPAAIAHWESALETFQDQDNLDHQAIVLENLARAYRSTGQTTTALQYWERVANLHRQLGDVQHVGRMLTEQAQTHTSLGHYRQAIAILCGAPNSSPNSTSGNECTPNSSLEIASAVGDRSGEAAALGSLGDAYRLRGDYQQAIDYLQRTLELGREIENPIYQSSALNGLGNTYARLAQVSDRRAREARERGDRFDAQRLEQEMREYDTKAIGYFEDSLAIAVAHNHPSSQLRMMLNAIPSYYRLGNIATARTRLQQATDIFATLPASRDTAFAAIDLANLLELTASPDRLGKPLSGTTCFSDGVRADARILLEQAITTAQQIEDYRAESFALGKLGQMYECESNYEQALDLTQQARWAADQDLQARDSLYLWEWQTGRILKAQGKEEDAIDAYEQAVTTLEEIRSDILVAERDLQFDFRDTIEPIYRQLVELQLSQDGNQIGDSDALIQTGDRTSAVDDALTTIDSLKLAELQNYFGNDCVVFPVSEIRITTVGLGTAAAVFNSIILADRTAIILTLPNGQQQTEWINVSQDTLNDEINAFRIGLERFFDPVYDPAPAQIVYNRLIRPFETDLAQTEIDTLVFVQDGILRSVPMAALHDGERFLIERYAVANTPTLTLTDPQPLSRRQFQVLALGLTQPALIEGREFEALNHVSLEIQEIEQQLPNTRKLIDEEFTRDRLRQELTENSYPIIHIATHGEFGAEPEDTFLVTGANEKLTITELESFIRTVGGTNQIELLALTACQTAIGDDRSALGLAGVAVQAGARSAIASFWSINDEATARVMAQFYKSLQDPALTKAAALRQAQLSLIHGDNEQSAHPAYWAPFVLIGNWL